MPVIVGREQTEWMGRRIWQDDSAGRSPGERLARFSFPEGPSRCHSGVHRSKIGGGFVALSDTQVIEQLVGRLVENVEALTGRLTVERMGESVRSNHGVSVGSTARAWRDLRSESVASRVGHRGIRTAVGTWVAITNGRR